MTAKKLLGSSSWIIRSNQIANIFKSNDAAILLGYLCDKDSFYSTKWEEKGKQFDGWFFREADKIEKETVCTPFIQRKWFAIFEEIGLIKLKLKGVPPKKHFKINEEVLNLLMVSKYQTGAKLNVNHVKNQMSTGLTHINNNIINKNRVEDKSSTNIICSKKKINGNSSIIEKVNTSKKDEKNIHPDLFDKFWELYPRKKGVSKAKALISWNKLCTKSSKERPNWKTIKKAIKSQNKSERWQKQPEYIPHPSTWLNQNRWLDEADSLDVLESFDKPKNDFTYHGGYKVTKKSTKM